MNPTLRLAILILAFLAPAGISVCSAWWAWHSRKKRDAFPQSRSILELTGLIAATVGFVLETAFLVREYVFSYLPADSIPLRQAAAWTGALTWLVALVAVILGRGKARWFLFAFVVTSLAGVVLFVGLMD